MGYESKNYFDSDSIFGKTISKKTLKDEEVYKKIDIASGLLSVVRKTFSLINAKLFALFIIVSFLFCFLFHVGFVWFGVESIMQGNVFNGIISIILGIGIDSLIAYGRYQQLFEPVFQNNNSKK